MRAQSTASELFLKSFAFSVLLSRSGAMLVLLAAVLYDRGAKDEEDILLHDRSYREYRQQVKYRFVPGGY